MLKSGLLSSVVYLFTKYCSILFLIVFSGCLSSLCRLVPILPRIRSVTFVTSSGSMPCSMCRVASSTAGERKWCVAPTDQGRRRTLEGERGGIEALGGRAQT